MQRKETTTGKCHSDADKGHPVSNGTHKGYGATRFARHRLATRVTSLILAAVLILVLLPDYTPASLTVQATGTEELTTEETQTTGGSTAGNGVDTQTTEESTDGNSADAQTSGTGNANGADTTCTCTVACTADAINKDCAVCGADGADLSACKCASANAHPQMRTQKKAQRIFPKREKLCRRGSMPCRILMLWMK